MPQIIETTDMIGINIRNGAYGTQGMTPQEFFQTVKEHPERLCNYTSEIAKDLEDVVHFYNLTFRELREGKTVSPRILEFPS